MTFSLILREFVRDDKFLPLRCALKTNAIRNLCNSSIKSSETNFVFEDKLHVAFLVPLCSKSLK